MNLDKVEQLICKLLIELGGDPDREGLVRTPTRIAAPVEYLTSGYRGDVEKLINKAIFKQAMNNMIIGRDIEIYSLSEDHAVRIASASALFGNARLISTHQGSAARDIGDGAERQPRWRTTLNKVSLLTGSIRRRAKLGAGWPPSSLSG
jgi:hypothetical protein